jgi:hypothetical protein
MWSAITRSGVGQVGDAGFARSGLDQAWNRSIS